MTYVQHIIPPSPPDPQVQTQPVGPKYARGLLVALFLELPLKAGSDSPTPWGAEVGLYLGGTAETHYGSCSTRVQSSWCLEGTSRLPRLYLSPLGPTGELWVLSFPKFCLTCSVMQSKREAQPTCFAEAIASASSWGLTAGTVVPVGALCVAIATMMSHICCVFVIYPVLFQSVPISTS